MVAALAPNRIRRSRSFAALRWEVLWLAFAILLCGAVAEFTFWKEFTTRFNFIAVDYLLPAHELIGSVVKSYRIGAILGGIGVLALARTLPVSRLICASREPRTFGHRLALLGLAIALPAATTERLSTATAIRSSLTVQVDGRSPCGWLAGRAGGVGAAGRKLAHPAERG